MACAASDASNSLNTFLIAVAPIARIPKNCDVLQLTCIAPSREVPEEKEPEAGEDFEGDEDPEVIEADPAIARNKKILELRNTTDMSVARIAEECGVSRTTVYKIIAKE